MDTPRSQSASRRARHLIALSRARLLATRPGRIGRASGALCLLGFGGVAVVLYVMEGAGGSVAGLTRIAAEALPWLVGAPLAFAAASDRASIDRADGIEALAAARGVSSSSMESARALGAMAATAGASGPPLVILALLGVALAGQPSAMIHRASTVLGAAVFAGIAGIALGGLGAACGRIARRQGRWLLLGLVVAPWALAELAGHGAWSLPGALGAVLDFLVSSGGGVSTLGLAG